MSELGWHVISGEDLLQMLRRVESGEAPDLVYAEEYVNADREQIEADGSVSGCSECKELRAEIERLRGVHLAASEMPWSFHQGTLRERLEWCRAQHQIAAENPPLHPPTREAKADFDRACVGWYDDMLRQLDEIERAA